MARYARYRRAIYAILAASIFVTTAATLAADAPSTQSSDAGSLLYNGIRLPAAWPPRAEKWQREPMPLPYLTTRPAVVPIDVGRQLFVDDFLIERTTLHRSFHSATYVSDNPVMKPDKPWELTGKNPTAMVFSDGVWYDPADRLFKMWYMGGYAAGTCYATSADGFAWEKPTLDAIRAGTNLVHLGSRDSGTVWLDSNEKDPARRYKMFVVEKGWRIGIYFSGDGIHWGKPVMSTTALGDRSTVFYNPFRGVWVFSLRGTSRERIRLYLETPDLLSGATYQKTDPVVWVGADKLDTIRQDLKTPPQLYNLDAAPYESVMLGLFTIWRGQPRDRAKPNEVLIGWSRDGFHWDRTNRDAFLPVSEHQGDWNWGNVQSAGGGCLVVGDKLYFYVSGRAGIPGTQESGVSTTSLATIRRDGFASMDTEENARNLPPDETLETRPVQFSGKYLFVNAAVPDGELVAEVLDESGKAIEPFTEKRCKPVRGDHTLAAVTWENAELGTLAGKPVRFRFHIRASRAARLYSFWVSPDASGASHGYVAAGGPGFTSDIDTVGAGAAAP